MPQSTHDPIRVSADISSVLPGQRICEHEQQVADLKAALASSAVINQAMGILMARSNCGSVQAFTLLTHASQRTNRKVRDVAGTIVRRYCTPTERFRPRAELT
ncbi:ANTAR domain-containing protein [Allonocardiopsis opalescens]|uniref:ANTAR domain-containing protein n=1 Tax=Allonocardiopsis opalescens TaxID=1144618 RepID=A0A2T0PZ75_9ACTN|nr:ANTAR domain-containing protein [Allonocardiopsis opalescens]PRX96828.1 ANTAR domain-containing protein [Allonocardiopsis opalescens]